MKLWNGRFQKEIDADTDRFLASIFFDIRLAKYDISGSIAHTKMLAHCKIIKQQEAKKIIIGLRQILQEIETSKLSFSFEDEDIHMLIEKRLIEKIGDTGGKLHTARSRNDQVSLDIRMYLRDEIKEIINLIVKFQKSLFEKAQNNTDVIMPGFTHLQHAQPILFSHHILAYWWMLERDKGRLIDCLKRVNVMPLGAGALAGTSFPIDREYVAGLLEFPQISQNSIDTVSDRDFIIEFLSFASIVIMHLSRLSEEIVLWNSSEFSFIEIDDAFCTGSSIMPQKKNPDVAELIRGKTGRIYGSLMAVLTLMKSLPLAYNKDMQEDKEGLFDSIDTIKEVLLIFPKMLDSINAKKEKMYESCKKGFLNATNVADYLAEKGMPFREAHKVTGKIVDYCIKNNKTLDDLSLEEFCRFSEKFKKDIKKFISIRNCVNVRNSAGGTSFSALKKQIEKIKKLMGNKKKYISALIFLFSAVVLTSNVYAEDFSERKLNLQQSIKLAMLNNQNLLSKEQDIYIAKQKVNEAKSFMYPQMDLNCNISQLKTVSALALSPVLGGIWIAPNEEENFYAMQLSLYQYVYQGSWFRGDIKRLADINLKGANSGYEQIKNEIKYEVKKVFYKFILLREEHKMYQNAIDEAKETFGKYKNLSLIYELKWEALMSSLAADLKKREKDIALAKIDFNSVLGIELNTGVNLIGKLEAESLKVDLNKYTAWAFQYRPELLQTQAQEEMDSLAVNLSLRERYPTVVIGANYQYGGSSFPLNDRNWVATVNVNLPIFDAWAQWARIKQKKADLKKARYQKVAVEDKVRLEVNRSYLEFISAQEMLESSAKNLVKAKQIWGKAQLTKNKNSYDEFMQIYEFYTKVKLEYIKHVYEQISNRAALEKAIGMDLVEE